MPEPFMPSLNKSPDSDQKNAPPLSCTEVVPESVIAPPTKILEWKILAAVSRFPLVMTVYK